MSDTSTPVYVAITGPSAAAASWAARPTRGNDRAISQPAAVICAAERRASVHVPTLIGDVGLSTRSMFRKRSGRPRS